MFLFGYFRGNQPLDFVFERKQLRLGSILRFEDHSTLTIDNVCCDFDTYRNNPNSVVCSHSCTCMNSDDHKQTQAGA